jgi:hypothetical protein
VLLGPTRNGKTVDSWQLLPAPTDIATFGLDAVRNEEIVDNENVLYPTTLDGENLVESRALAREEQRHLESEVRV